MTDPHPVLSSLAGIGELTKPATVLIEKVSDAIGGLFRPWQIGRVAQAEAQAEKTKAIAQIEITELQQRALRRFFVEEAKKQDNMESITKQALAELREDSRPQDIDDDWITNFYGHCRLVSDKDMQALWARVLSGEANNPGSFSRRTLNLIPSLGKSDAELFTRLCSYAADGPEPTVLIIDHKHPIYKTNGINFDSLLHLSGLGLIEFDPIAQFALEVQPKSVVFLYRGRPIVLSLPKDEGNKLAIGEALLMQPGVELARICGAAPLPGFYDYLVTTWTKKGYITPSPPPQDTSKT